MYMYMYMYMFMYTYVYVLLYICMCKMSTYDACFKYRKINSKVSITIE